ncbi:MAG: hypothetical protein U0K23_05595, partial [Selenomonadaceae bacterium]|nr:hypothetical protein [Selenomonadaceae bacterium]
MSNVEKSLSEESPWRENNPIGSNNRVFKDDIASNDIGISMGTGAANTGATQYMVEDVDRFITPRGHGFAAEKMNHYWDKAHGHNAITEEQADVRYAKNGWDRKVDGIEIQTKYCKTGSKCIGECFENGEFRYINKETGKP